MFEHFKTDLRWAGVRQNLVAWVFLLPFLFVYVAFLIYPFGRGVWISLHDWNLLAVTFNPDAKTFIGLDNYLRLFWGTEMTWRAWARPVLQGLCVLAAVFCFWRYRNGELRWSTLWQCVMVLLLLMFFFGWAPGEGGRWFDRRFWPTVGNTVFFVAMVVPAITLISLLLATALNRETRGAAFLRTLFFLSQVLSVTVVTLIWQMMFSARQGLLANVTREFGGVPLSWLAEPGFAMAAIVIATVWWSIGIAMVLFLAGLQDIPQEMQEAARLDRANSVQAFWYIILPNLKRTTTLVVILQIILHFQVFGQAHLMTQGGPNDQTQVLVRYIYQTAFRDSDLGIASAMAVFLFVIMAVFSIVQFMVSREDEQ